MSRRRGRILIGLSGWKYAPFRGKFYPRRLRQADELAYAAERFPTLEINGSFYSLQKPEYYARWHDETPEGFVFAVKGGRFITHMKKLVNVETPLANFFASGVLRLEEKLGPFLWQFPTAVPCDAPRFEAFFRLLPRDTFEAAKLAKKHDPWLKGRVSVSSSARRSLRHAVEVRSASCTTPEFVQLLRRHDIGLVVADTAGKFPYQEDVTSDFVYVRLHGDEELYSSGYSPTGIAHWAKRVTAWASGEQPTKPSLVSSDLPARRRRDVYVYFDNDARGHAPFDALALIQAVDKRATHSGSHSS
ncbi:MAG TPA: DUF72 domain-containing protein [Polyangiaceae bacterium]|jgi:uncharacterized protein YecE (DUF72 family)|nr:DUF72 domain-containing protein [Polyangiaceae bacterium]